MTNVKSLHFDSTQLHYDHLKVTFSSGDVILLNTDERGDVAAVLKDLENGEFDYNYGWFDSPVQVEQWDKDHPNAVLVYGE